MMKRTAIKWAATRLSRRVSGAGKPPTQQVSYMDQVANVSLWTPYGFDAAVPPDKLALLLSILGNPDNQVGLMGSPGEGPALEDTEVAVYHPPTGSKIHFLKDGSITIVSGSTSITMTVAGGIKITPGATPLTVDGDLVVTGTLAVTGASTLGAAVTAGGVNIGSTHGHLAGTYLDSVGSPVTGTAGIPV